MEPTVLIPLFVDAVQAKVKDTNESITQMVDRIHTSEDFSISVARINRVLDEITLMTDLLTLNNALVAAAPTEVLPLSPTV